MKQMEIHIGKFKLIRIIQSPFNVGMAQTVCDPQNYKNKINSLVLNASISK